jgi:type I restriction-modification system DNA methylase subunit
LFNFLIESPYQSGFRQLSVVSGFASAAVTRQVLEDFSDAYLKLIIGMASGSGISRADCQTYKDVEDFAKVASLADIRANDGILSIPLYVRGKAVSEGKAEYAADGLKKAIKDWEESSNQLQVKVNDLLKTLEN